MTLAPSLAPVRGARSLSTVGIFLVAVLVRLVVAAATVGFGTPADAEPASDSRIHMQIVRSLLAGGGYALDGEPVASTPPLYVFFLAGLYGLGATPAAVRVLQALLGACGCLLLYAAGRRIFDEFTGLVAAGLLAVHPAASYLAGLHLTENLFLPLLLLVVLQAHRTGLRPTLPNALVLGGLAGLAALARAAFLAFLPFLFWWAIATWGARSRVTYRTAALAGVGCALVLLPWTVRNAVVLGAFVPVQSNGAMVFWAGNNPHAEGGLVWPTRRTWTGDRPPDDGHYGWRDLSVSQENALYLREAVRWIREHPQDYLRLVGRKLVRLYGSSRATDGTELQVPLGVAVFQVVLYGLGAAGAWLAWVRRRLEAILVLLFVFTNLMAILFSGASRYALPMVPSLLLWAAFGVREAWRWAVEGT
jgi:4-amino-4-deoxy-L-arabinose transferase-like glycosyltransferase